MDVLRAASEMCARARAERVRAEELRRAAAANRHRTEELCERLASGGLDARKSYGDRGKRFVLRLGRLRPLLGFARNELRRWLESMDLSAEVVDDATLACSEACANAIEHAGNPTRQLVEIEGRIERAQLLLRVRDYGSWVDHRRSDHRGRGISMINKLMDAVEIERHDSGTEISMRRQLTARGDLRSDA